MEEIEIYDEETKELYAKLFTDGTEIKGIVKDGYEVAVDGEVLKDSAQC